MDLSSKCLLLGAVLLASSGALAARSVTVPVDSSAAKKAYAATADRGSKRSAGHAAGGLTIDCKGATSCAVTLYPDARLPAAGQRPAGLPASWPRFDSTRLTRFSLAAATCLKLFKAMGNSPYETSEGGVVRSMGYWMTGATLTAIGDQKDPAKARHAICTAAVYKVPKK